MLMVNGEKSDHVVVARKQFNRNRDKSEERKSCLLACLTGWLAGVLKPHTIVGDGKKIFIFQLAIAIARDPACTVNINNLFLFFAMQCIGAQLSVVLIVVI